MRRHPGSGIPIKPICVIIKKKKNPCHKILLLYNYGGTMEGLIPLKTFDVRQYLLIYII
jgi:hypothetical protein